jgi:hypothetical protein
MKFEDFGWFEELMKGLWLADILYWCLWEVFCICSVYGGMCLSPSFGFFISRTC